MRVYVYIYVYMYETRAIAVKPSTESVNTTTVYSGNDDGGGGLILKDYVAVRWKRTTESSHI